MNEKVALIFIGEQVSNQECWIKSKPSFSDAIVLSTQSSHQTSCVSYQHILLDYKSNSIQISDSDIQLTCDRDSLMITQGSKSKQLTEEEVFDIINNFAFKKGNKVTFLCTVPYRKSKKRKKNKNRVLEVGKKLEV
ncbi:hypothetical protein [Neobacillus sp. PS2-9]|uniref:hypothetical protein n=1 Tax=Neobacillus sp. PS2-9 TaxID=3070676 RepID=UPI0027DFAF3A|nr:hypothetical protein [Neobacillus sp. PS2-9]WML58492.1 hypothetical protein RCG25_01365 [Neobacillus sp. PS2-9]